MNDSGTSASFCAETVPTDHALTVLPSDRLHDISFGMENARRYFMAQRVLDGPDTAIGHRWSNLIEVVQNQRLAETKEQYENLFAAFAWNFMGIADLKRGRTMRKLSRPQLLLAYQTKTFTEAA